MNTGTGNRPVNMSESAMATKMALVGLRMCGLRSTMETKELLTTVRNTRIGDRKPLIGTVYLRGVNRKVSQLEKD